MELFENIQPIIGMVHLLPLPNTPQFTSLDDVYERAVWEAETLAEAGVDGLIVENFGDEPYTIGEPTTAQIAAMAAITREIRRRVTIPVGVNVQFNAWEAEMAIAYACQAEFVRVEVFVDTVVSAQGIVHPCSAQITRYRRQLGADVHLWADIQTKYTQNLVGQPITQSAVDAQAAGADALIVTGAATGQATPIDTVADVKNMVTVPVLVGSGTNVDNVANVLAVADGAIVGSAFKEGGVAANKVSREATVGVIAAARGAD